MANKLSQEEIQKIQILRDSGLSIYEVEEKSGISHASVSKYTTAPNQRLSKDLVSKMRWYFDEGMTVPNISKLMGIDYHTVYFHVKRNRVYAHSNSPKKPTANTMPMDEYIFTIQQAITIIQERYQQLFKRVEYLENASGLLNAKAEPVSIVEEVKPIENAIEKPKDNSLLYLRKIYAQNKMILSKLAEEKATPMIQEMVDDRTLIQKMVACRNAIDKSKTQSELYRSMKHYHLSNGKIKMPVTLIGDGLIVSQYSELLAFVGMPDVNLEEVKTI